MARTVRGASTSRLSRPFCKNPSSSCPCSLMSLALQWRLLLMSCFMKRCIQSRTKVPILETMETSHYRRTSPVVAASAQAKGLAENGRDPGHTPPLHGTCKAADQPHRLPESRRNSLSQGALLCSAVLSAQRASARLWAELIILGSDREFATRNS